jgi:hypothetical protein
MTATVDKTKLTLIKRDPQAPSTLPGGRSIRIIGPSKSDTAAKWHNLFVLVAATGLSDVAEYVSAANKQNQLRALFVRYDVDPEWLPQMFELANLRTMRNTFFHSDFKLPWRVLRAWQAGSQGELIADARVVGDELFVLSCEPETYRVPFASIPVLRKMTVQERGDFRLADDGSYLHWPGQDIHLDLDALLVAIVPERRMRAEKVKHAYGQRYGEGIARLRSEKGLRQNDIAGLSEREVRRIESDGRITVDSLRKLAAAHRMELPDYLRDLAQYSRGSDKVAERPSSSRLFRAGYHGGKKK